MINSYLIKYKHIETEQSVHLFEEDISNAFSWLKLHCDLGQISNNPLLFYLMVRYRTVDNQLYESITAWITDAYMHHWAEINQRAGKIVIAWHHHLFHRSIHIWYYFCTYVRSVVSHDDVIKWKHFPRYWPFVGGIPRSPVKSPHKGQWRGALMFSLICAWINSWVNNRQAGDLMRHRTHYDVTAMYI